MLYTMLTWALDALTPLHATRHHERAHALERALLRATFERLTSAQGYAVLMRDECAQCVRAWEDADADFSAKLETLAQYTGAPRHALKDVRKARPVQKRKARA